MKRDYFCYYTISGLSLITVVAISSSKSNGVTYPSRFLAFCLKLSFSEFTYILAFPFPFLASWTKFETGEFPSNARTI